MFLHDVTRINLYIQKNMSSSATFKPIAMRRSNASNNNNNSQAGSTAIQLTQTGGAISQTNGNRGIQSSSIVIGSTSGHTVQRGSISNSSSNIGAPVHSKTQCHHQHSHSRDVIHTAQTGLARRKDEIQKINQQSTTTAPGHQLVAKPSQSIPASLTPQMATIAASNTDYYSVQSNGSTSRNASASHSATINAVKRPQASSTLRNSTASRNANYSMIKSSNIVVTQSPDDNYGDTSPVKQQQRPSLVVSSSIVLSATGAQNPQMTFASHSKEVNITQRQSIGKQIRGQSMIQTNAIDQKQSQQ